VFHDLRRRFESFCGTDDYRRFLRALNTTCLDRGRLFYWQERLWARFAESQAETLPTEYAEIASAFRLCDVHGNELTQGEVPAVSGLFRYPDGYWDAHSAEFPFANTYVALGCRGEDGVANVYYCQACRAHMAQSRWRKWM
jgi:hypothetical protein